MNRSKRRLKQIRKSARKEKKIKINKKNGEGKSKWFEMGWKKYLHITKSIK